MPLLEAFAKEKGVKIEKDRKEAAIAYRNLGAIAGLRDPKEAAEAYAKPIELDPDDRESLYWHSWLSPLAGHLPDAEQSLGRLLKLASAAGDQRGIYRANLRLGELTQERGNLAAAQEYEEKAKKIASKQEAANPANAEWQRDLSISYESVGDVLFRQGNLPEALKSYQAGFAIADRLAKSNPGNTGWQRDFAVSFAKLANVHKQLRDRAKAREYLRQGQAILARLTKLSPDNAEWKSDLAWFDSEIAELEGVTADVRPSPRRSKHK